MKVLFNYLAIVIPILIISFILDMSDAEVGIVLAGAALYSALVAREGL